MAGSGFMLTWPVAPYTTVGRKIVRPQPPVAWRSRSSSSCNQ